MLTIEVFGKKYQCKYSRFGKLGRAKSPLRNLHLYFKEFDHAVGNTLAYLLHKEDGGCDLLWVCAHFEANIREDIERLACFMKMLEPLSEVNEVYLDLLDGVNEKLIIWVPHVDEDYLKSEVSIKG